MNKKFYTGVGSRETPPIICKFMTELAASLENIGYVLRSGGADGADLAFESGVSDPNNKEIWVPWKGFNGNASRLLPSNQAYDIAKTIHPVWNKLSDPAKRLHARNCHQVLGADLNTPSNFLICYTDNAEIKGGTATAINLALNNNIPVINLGKWKNVSSMYDAIKDFLILNGEENEI